MRDGFLLFVVVLVCGLWFFFVCGYCLFSIYCSGSRRIFFVLVAPALCGIFMFIFIGELVL